MIRMSTLAGLLVSIILGLVGSSVAAAGGTDVQRSRLAFLGSRDNTGDVIVSVNPTTETCRAFGLPEYSNGAVSGVAFSDDRVTYQYGASRIWVGRAGGTFHRVRTIGITAGPVWAGRSVAYAKGGYIRLASGGSVEPRLPRGATIEQLAPQGGRFAVYATWGPVDSRGTRHRGALFLVAGNATKEIEREPFVAGEQPNPVWSPDGSRLAIVRNGDLWTIRPNGKDAVRLTHNGDPTRGGPGPVVWSPDSSRVVYAAFGRIYVQSSTGGPRLPIASARAAWPLAWLGHTIALRTRSFVLGLVRDTGGPVQRLCPSLAPVASLSASWRRR